MSTPTYDDILDLTHGLQQDLRAANAKLVTIRSWLAAQPAEKRTAWICPHCQVDRKGPNALTEHLTNVHGIDTDQAQALVARVVPAERMLSAFHEKKG